MNEEEKEAIKILNNINLLYCGKEDERAIETILNLVEKQQKEIEELGNRKAENYYHWKHLEANIINKIEELESVLDLANDDKRIAKYKKEALKEEIEDLNEILGE